MGIQVVFLEKDGIVKISPVGRFDFSCHREFRDAYAQREPGVQYIVDLRQTDYMDSSALGMLLLLREHAGGDAARIRISNARADVRSVLGIANFEKLFIID